MGTGFRARCSSPTGSHLLDQPMITPFGEIPNSLAARMSLQEQHDWFARRLSRRTMIRGLASVSGALVLPTLWTPPARASESTRIRGRHVAYGSDPTTSMVVDFSIKGDVATARVETCASSGGGVAVDARIAKVAGSKRQYGRAIVTGLMPSTTYSYRIILDGRQLSDGTFRTAPSGPAPFRFTAFGDQGTTAPAREMLAQVRAQQPLLHLLAGDLCYADASGAGGAGDILRPAVWDHWLDQNDVVAASVPWMSVPGNHEMEPGFGIHGYAGYLTRVFPGGASPIEVPVASTFRVGSVGFVGLDSNDVSYEIPANRGWTQNAQTAWLDRTLADLRSGSTPVDFIVAFMHHAPYSTSTAHASEGGIRESWVPLFDKHSVDLVISGHNHAYERALPLRNGVIVSQDPRTTDSSKGTTYITAGGGGATAYASPAFIEKANMTRVSTAEGREVENEKWSLPTKTAEHLVLSVDVEPALEVGGLATMTVRAVDTAGTERDRTVLTRISAASSQATSGVLGGEVPRLLALGSASAIAGTAVVIHRRRSARKSGGLNEPAVPARHE